MLWKFSTTRQRLLLYFITIWVLGMAFLLSEMVGTHPPALALRWFPGLPWETICPILLYCVVGVVAAELIMLLLRQMRATNDRLELQRSLSENFAALNPFGVVTFDSEGRLLSCNRAAATIFGAPLPATYSLTCDEFFLQAHLLSKIKSVFAGHVVQLGEISYDTRGLKHVQLPAREITLRVTFFPILDKNHVVNSIVGMYEDVTEKVKMERQLTRAQRMESIGTLAGGIAHDFNNILGGVLGNISLLKPKVPADSPLQRYIQTIEASVRRATQLTRQLLTFVRGELSQLKPTRINDCVENVVRLIESSFDKKYVIAKQLEPQPLTVECDAGQIEQALLNLCLNARDAMPSGGRITLSSRNVFVKDRNGTHHPGSPELEVGAYVVLSVADTGTGMNEETQKRVFEPFFTTKAPGKGTGLGLAMVFGIMKNHGGHIDLQSQLGKGTTFQLYLKANLKAAIEETVKEEKPVSGGHECILVVDDEQVIRDFAAETLRDKGYAVLTAEDGAKAIDLFARRPREINLVVTDMVMPNASGRQVFASIRSIRPDIKFIFSSGYTDSDVLHDAVKRRQVIFIQKPYTGEELCKLVRKTLDASLPNSSPPTAAARPGAPPLAVVGSAARN